MDDGSVDDLRSKIWDYLYRLGQPQQIAAIAEQMHENPDTIQQAVSNPWFTQQDDMIGIA